MTQYVPIGHRQEVSALHMMVLAHTGTVSPWNMGTDTTAKTEANIHVTAALHIHLTVVLHMVVIRHPHMDSPFHTVEEWWCQD